MKNRPSRKLSIMAGLFLVFLILIGDFAAGFIGIGSPRASSGETTLWNANTSSCTISAGGNTCTNSFTWPTPLSASPCLGCALATPTTATGGTSAFTLLDTETVYFFSLETTGQNWANMPAAQTEIFGDNCQHCISVDLHNNMVADFFITCNAGSNTPGATLTLQYQFAGSGTWIDITPSAIDINLLCPSTGIVSDSCLTSTGNDVGCYGITIPSGINTGSLENSWMRIVGQGGGGIGDVPNFVEAGIMFKTTTTLNFQPTVSVVGATSTTITIQARINVVQTTSTTINWRMKAWICRTGGSGPC